MKIEVYKDSKGNLHEKEEDYMLAEFEIQRDSLSAFHARITESVEHNPLVHYMFLKDLKQKIEANPDFDKECDEFIEFFKKAAELKKKKDHTLFKGKGPDLVNPNWNDSPGEWRGISAQDLGIPNC